MKIDEILGTRRIQIIDVGARDGLHIRWDRFLPWLDQIGFEADETECARLNANLAPQKARRRFLPYALSDREGAKTFHVCSGPGYSGLYEPNQGFIAPFAASIKQSMEVKRRFEVSTKALNDIAKIEGLQPDCLKIDVQGAELDILTGATSLLPRTKMIELEVEFNPQYVSQPIFSDVDRFMREQGFLLLGLRRTFWRRQSQAGFAHTTNGGQIVHGDVLYYNAGAVEAQRNDAVELAVWLVLLSAYRQQDFVEYLLSSTTAFDDVTATALRQSFRDRTDAFGSLVMALARLITSPLHHRAARALVDACRRAPAIDWHDPDFF